MQSLLIEQEDDSPKVVFDIDKQTFIIEGESRPQHAFKFYQPIIQWLDEYKKSFDGRKDSSKKLILQLKLSYFNSTSAKYLSDILFLLDAMAKEGHEVAVKWFYQKEDVDMHDTAEEYKRLVKKLPIQLELIV